MAITTPHPNCIWISADAMNATGGAVKNILNGYAVVDVNDYDEGVVFDVAFPESFIPAGLEVTLMYIRSFITVLNTDGLDISTVGSADGEICTTHSKSISGHDTGMKIMNTKYHVDITPAFYTAVAGDLYQRGDSLGVTILASSGLGHGCVDIGILGCLVEW